MTAAISSSVNYKLCYSSNVQTLFGLLRKNKDAGDDDAIKQAASALGMTLKCWKTPTGYYHSLKYVKSPLHPMYPSASVVQQFAQDNNNNNNNNATPEEAEATIQGRGLFRSVVINDAGNIVAFSPPKTINFNSAADSVVLEPMPIADLFVAEEFVEGTMINLFYNPSIGSGSGSGSGSGASTNPISGWEISTKGVVGGMIVVPKPGSAAAAAAAGDKGANKENKNDGGNTKSTFRALFLDACIKNGIEFDKLDTQYTYSLVLQHPENPLVCNIPESRVYLIAVYSIDNATLTVTRHPRSAVDWKSIGFRVPREYSASATASAASAPGKNAATTFHDVRNRYANPAGTSPYRIMGVMLHSANAGAGWSFKLRNPSYESAKHAPLEHGKRLLFEYCSMRHTHDVKSHIKLCPEDATTFSEFQERIRAYTSQLYSNYVECFITKVRPLLEYAPNLRTHMYRMHNDIYKARRTAAAGGTAPSFDPNSKPKPNRCGLKFQDAVQYVNLIMSPTELYCALTYVPNPISTTTASSDSDS